MRQNGSFRALAKQKTWIASALKNVWISDQFTDLIFHVSRTEFRAERKTITYFFLS